jgi:VWFA-related protein
MTDHIAPLFVAALKAFLRLTRNHNGLDSRGLYTPAATGLGDASHSGDSNWMNTMELTDTMRDEDRVAWQNGSAMAQLAEATGGVYFHGGNDLLKGLRRAFDDERVRYSLAYEPSNSASDGSYRKITVEVKRKGLHVLAKAGYWSD